MKIKFFKLIFVLYLLSIDISTVFAQDTACIDNARTNNEVDECFNQLIPPKEIIIERIVFLFNFLKNNIIKGIIK